MNLFYNTLLSLLLVSTVFSAPLEETDNEVFRYESEDKKSFHFMNGEPGRSVQGGWGFESPEGEAFQLMYKANELGFQPEADYLPSQVEDTREVSIAKAQFRSAYDNFKAMVKKAALEYQKSLEENQQAESEPSTLEKVEIEDDEENLEDVEVVERSKRQAVLPYYYTSFYPSVVYQPSTVFVRKEQNVGPQRVMIHRNPVYVQPSSFRVLNKPSNFVPDIPETEESGVLEA